MGKKLVMAQRRGETRALCLGAAMVVCAVITYYILGTTVLPLYQKRYQTLLACPHPPASPLRVQSVRNPSFFPTPPPLTLSPGRKVWTIVILRVKDSCHGGQTSLGWDSGTWGHQIQEAIYLYKKHQMLQCEFRPRRNQSHSNL